MESSTTFENTEKQLNSDEEFENSETNNKDGRFKKQHSYTYWV